MPKVKKKKEEETKEEPQYESKCETCQRYATCSAPLCPLDEDLEERVWYAEDEDDVCLSQMYNKDVRWIKKQKSILRKNTRSWYGNKPAKYQDLVDASRPPKISEEMQKQRRDRMKSLQEAKKNKKDKLEEM